MQDGWGDSYQHWPFLRKKVGVRWEGIFVSRTEFCYCLLGPWTPDLSTWLNQLRQFSQCVLLLSLLVRSAAVPAGTFCYSLDLMQGYWVPWSPTQLVPPCLNFLVGRLWLFILLGSLGHQHLLSPSLFFLLHHPGDCLQLLTSKPAVVLQTPFSPLFPLYLGVQLALSFQNPLSGPFLLSLL